MTVIVVGSGKLAKELLNKLSSDKSLSVISWANASMTMKNSIVVHAGSGRELDSVIAYCQQTESTLIEAATGSDIADHHFEFPVVVCPNTNILMLKFMSMMANYGQNFKNFDIKIIESHQAEKSSTPGTAVNLAQSLGIESSEIISVRNPVEQKESLNIPEECLARHAYHKIEIGDSNSCITFETKVFGSTPYANGLAQIISAINSNKLDNRRYSVLEFIELGWL